MLVRSSVTEHGMAYGPRGLRSRSSNSSRGRDAPPGRTGEPSTGRSGAGGWIIGCCEVREMRNAEATPVILLDMREKTTGELRDTERVMRSSGGSGWKSTQGQLAGRLPYRSHGSQGPGWW